MGMAMLRLVVMAAAEGAAMVAAMAVATVVVVVVVEVVMVDLHHMIVVLVVVVMVVLVVVVVVVAFLNRSALSKISISSPLFFLLFSVMAIRTGPNLRRHSIPRLLSSSKAWVAPCLPMSSYLSV
jgi:hypothetical protein